MRIALTISSLGIGGAQYVMTWLAETLVSHGHTVSLHCFDTVECQPFFPLHRDIKLLRLGLASPSSNISQALMTNYARVRGLRQSVLEQRPDVALSFMTEMNVLALLALSDKVPVVVSERVNPVRHNIGPIWSSLRRIAYQRATAVVVQTQDILPFFSRRLRNRCTVIPNPVFPPQHGALPHAHLKRPIIVGLGRLQHQKGFDILLRAFAATREAHPEWSLVVYGEGPQLQELQDLCTRMGLNAQEIFPGVTHQAGAILAQADIFVLPSRFEGFPNALCQAMAAGVACIATNCESGPSNVIDQEVNGLLVPVEDEQGLTTTLARLMEDDGLRLRLGQRATEVLIRFAPDNVAEIWERLLSNISTRKGGGTCAV
ncbi:MAG: glycosyltransferase family 4 protein [Proteobacteria bacterium]|nr:glycosyltransferase family 4 protein [Pseudomonadota bacterium]